MTSSDAHYDLIVIGGGAGGQGAAKMAASFGKKVLLADHVSPTPHGTTWGFGGTCVNVGCIPKKLMHHAGSLANTLHHDSEKYGFDSTNNVEFKWSRLVETIQNYIKSLNFAYRSGMRQAKVEYASARAVFVGERRIHLNYTATPGKEREVTADHFLIAAGGRPHVPKELPGAEECCLTSDDIFSLKRSPGRTLVVGASYIALECAGFLNALGFDVTVAVRSIVLRGFDRQAAEKLREILECEGVRFIHTLPATFKKDGERTVVDFGDGTKDEFDTVLYATGREGCAAKLGLEHVGLIADNKGKLMVDEYHQTKSPHVFAVGDIAAGRPELLTTSLRAGEHLAKNLFSGCLRTPFNMKLIPTAIFTPMEYGTCGLSEEEAKETYGEDRIDVYLSEWKTLEFSASHREKAKNCRKDEMDCDFPLNCLAKLIVDKEENLKVIGFHLISPNAAEATQGFAVAMKSKARYEDFVETFGIHPTDSEALTSLTVTRASGEEWKSSGGCGGGSCG